VTVEMLLLVPVLLAVIIAATELSLMTAAQQKLEAASAVGARVAAQGGDFNAVREAVADSLGRGKIARANVTARLLGDDDLPLPSGAPIEVMVSVQADEVVPDMLAVFGFSIKEVRLAGRTLLRKE
jgi:hypothetical protein